MKAHLRGAICFLFTLILMVAACTTVSIINDPNDPLNVRILGVEPAPGPSVQGSCANDIDCDGLTDQMETDGFSIYNGQKYYVSCTPSPSVREDCVDPQSRDLFVVLTRESTNSLIPTTSGFKPFEFISKPESQGGLGIAVHEVQSNWVQQPERWVAKVNGEPVYQRAALVIEDNELDDFNTSCEGEPSAALLGWTSSPGRGIPNQVKLTSWVQTADIVGYIDYFCEDVSGVCREKYDTDITGATGECDLVNSPLTVAHLDSLDRRYIKHVLAHEVAHQIGLAYPTKPPALAYHHPLKTGKYHVMEKGVDVENGDSDYVFHIADEFCDQCRIARRVWE